MDRHQLPFCRAQTVAHTVGAGRAAADHGARLGAGRCNRLAGRQVTACHKDQLVHLRVGGKDYGCIINTAGQVASCDPKKITISVIKKNNTCDMVAKAGKFNISILTQDAPYKLFQRFGFQSGRDVDKFADVSYKIGRASCRERV